MCRPSDLPCIVRSAADTNLGCPAALRVLIGHWGLYVRGARELSRKQSFAAGPLVCVTAPVSRYMRWPT